ncbi:MAG TPA: response regulator, partial [Caldithrix abyssi]|nr:response regulator [Caldithrix abyssi]
GNVGYRVDTCRDGQEAVIKYSEELQGESPYDLVILDLTVPGGMGGKKTIEKLLRINPNVVAIVSSGYSNDPIMAEYEKFGFKGVVSKPYSAEQLIAVTNELLRSKNR